MKRLIIYSILSIASIYTYGQSYFSKADIKTIMKRVADWQIANPAKGHEHDDLNWTYAALYMGMIDWAELTEKEDGDNSYYEWLMKIGRRNAWQVGKYMYHADHIAVGQVFWICTRSITIETCCSPPWHVRNLSSITRQPAHWNWTTGTWAV